MLAMMPLFTKAFYAVIMTTNTSMEWSHGFAPTSNAASIWKHFRLSISPNSTVFFHTDYATPANYYDPQWDRQNQYWYVDTDTPWRFILHQTFYVHRDFQVGAITSGDQISGYLKSLEACEQVVRNDWDTFTGI